MTNKEFDVVKVGQWIKNWGGCNEWRTKSKWYQRCHGSLVFGLAFRSDRYDVVFSNNPSEWDLTDIRDYNPNEYELKMGDSVEVDNFGNTLNLVKFDYVDEEVVYRFGGSTIGQAFKYINKTKSVNGKKYDKITIPAFDFAKCLVDNGFTRDDGVLISGPNIRGSIFWISIHEAPTYTINGSLNIKPTPENAKLLIDMAKLAKGLK